MAKTILVPTDFTIRSLHTLRHALSQEHAQSLNIIFFTGVLLKDNIMDLLFFSRQTVIDGIVNGDFREACQIIRNKYLPRIDDMRFEIFTGFTQAAFSNFTEGNSVDELYIPENKLNYTDRCFDPTSYMRKSALPKIMVSWPEAQAGKQENHLSELFTSWT